MYVGQTLIHGPVVASRLLNLALVTDNIWRQLILQKINSFQIRLSVVMFGIEVKHGVKHVCVVWNSV